MKRLSYLCALFLCILFFSCKKEAVDFTPKAPPVFRDWDDAVTKVARDVSIKMNSLAFRKMLRHEVLLSFDGDANILLSSIVARLPLYLKYEREHSVPNLVESEDVLSSYNFDILTAASTQFPQMQLAVQPDADHWDPETQVLNVVYLTSAYDESTHSSVSGFDVRQSPITVSTLTDPEDNYVVVSQNERTLLLEDSTLVYRVTFCPVSVELRNAPYLPEENIIFPIEHPCGGGGGGTGGGETGGGGSGTPGTYTQYIGTGQNGQLPTLVGRQMGTIVTSPPSTSPNLLDPIGVFNGTTVYRKDFRHEKMRQIRCDNIGQIEGWPAGAPEIRVHVFAQNVLNPSENLQIFKEEFEPNRRKHIKDRWWNADGVTLHLWDYQGTGTKVSLGYYEYDPVVAPNEYFVAIGQIIVDVLTITGTIPIGTTGQVTVYGNIRQSVATGIRSLKKKNGMSEYIGKDDYSIFNNQDQFNHGPGGTKFRTSPDL